MSKFVSRRRKGGFTLIEIMIVVLIIAVLLAIAIPNFMRARESSRAKSCCANIRQLETAKEQWLMDNKTGTLPTTAAGFAPTYVKSEPTCPAAGTYTINDKDNPPSCSLGTNGTADTYDDHKL